MFTKKKRIITIIAVLTAAAMLAGCGKTRTETGTTEQAAPTAAQTAAGTTENTTAETVTSGSDMFSDRDYEVGYDESTAVTVTLNGSTAACGDISVIVGDGTVTLTQEGTYLLTGAYTGSVAIDMDKTAKPHIILKNAEITCADGAALYVAQADKVFVTLADGTVNTLANGGSFDGAEEGVDGAVFSRDDITFNGTGALTVTSPAGHGVVGKDDVAFTGGTYTVTSASHGIDANDSVRIDNAAITISAGKDGVRADNAEDETKGFVYLLGGSLTVDAQGDGVSASGDVTVEDGTIALVTGGGSENGEKKTGDGWGQFGGRPGPGGSGSDSAAADEDSASIKGVKAGGNIVVNGGSITVDAADDAIHANGSVSINEGALVLKTGDDGVHANETLTVTGGNITVTECYEGLEALSVNVTGGTVDIDADDDGLNAAGGSDESGFGGMRGGDMFGGRGGFGATEGAEINVSGGQITLRAGGDGIDSNGSVAISGGYIAADCPTQGDTSPFDYETEATITGGTLIATGSGMMAEGFTSNSQGVINGRLNEQSGGTAVTVTDGSGNVIISAAPTNPYNYILISAPELVSGRTYTLTVGGYSDTVTAR